MQKSSFKPYRRKDSSSSNHEPKISKQLKLEDGMQSTGDELLITVPLDVFNMLFENASRDPPKHRKKGEETKNLLRNFGNALTRFILQSKTSSEMIEGCLEHEESVKEFQGWVAKQKLENFEQYKQLWSYRMEMDEKEKQYKKLFSDLSFEFYSKHAYSYVMNSQMRTEDTKKIHIKYITRFLEGVLNPETFYYFKK